MSLPGPAIEMSVVLVADTYSRIRAVVDGFRRQTARARLELVLVVPSAEVPAAEAAHGAGFAAVRIVSVASIFPLAAARARGVRATTGPLIFIGETHSFPHPEMAEALIDAHVSPCAVVVPAFLNANPEGPLSWAAFLADYGAWIDGLAAEELLVVPTYNAAFRRSFLLQLGDRLEAALAQGEAMLAGLRALGGRACFEPTARIDHANVSRFGPWMHQRYVVGRIVAANRSARWPIARRMAYVFGASFIPPVVLARQREGVREAWRKRRLPAGTLPALLLGSVVKAAGEAVGYALGARDAARDRLDEYELGKLDYTTGVTSDAVRGCDLRRATIGGKEGA